MPKLREKQQLVAVLPAHIADKVRAQARKDNRSVSGWIADLLIKEFGDPEQLELPLE